MTVEPKIGVSKFPHVSAAQCSIPDKKSTKSWAMIKPRTTGRGPAWYTTVSLMSKYQR